MSRIPYRLVAGLAVCLSVSLGGCSDQTTTGTDGPQVCSRPEDCPIGQDCIDGVFPGSEHARPPADGDRSWRRGGGGGSLSGAGRAVGQRGARHLEQRSRRVADPHPVAQRVQEPSAHFAGAGIAELRRHPGRDSARLSFVVSNQGTGNSVLTVRGVQLASLVNDHFELVDLAGFPAYLGVGDSLPVWVEFHPAQVAELSDRVVVVSDDPDFPEAEVGLGGRGVSPELGVDPAPVDLGEVRVGAASEIAVKIGNRGAALLAIAGIRLAGGAEFSLYSDPVTGFDLANLSAQNPLSLQAGKSAG